MMKSRPTQFGVRENTASSGQHAPRLAVPLPLHESLSVLEGSTDLVEAREFAPGDLELFDLTLNNPTNEATGGRREAVAHSRTLVGAKSEQRNKDTSPVVNHGARRQAPHIQFQTEFEPLLDVAEAAMLLRMHPRTLRAKARKRIIPAIQVGRRWRFRASTLNSWLERLPS
jgi:excisionase family DNA binding protein